MLFQLMYMYASYIHTLYYIHTVDTYMTAVCVNVYMINAHITVLDFDGYARIATLNTDRLRIARTLITDSCY